MVVAADTAVELSAAAAVLRTLSVVVAVVGAAVDVVVCITDAELDSWDDVTVVVGVADVVVFVGSAGAGVGEAAVVGAASVDVVVVAP